MKSTNQTTATNPLADVSDARVEELEAEGMTHSDAVGVAMAEVMRQKATTTAPTLGPRFPLGQIVMTPGARDAMDEAHVQPIQFIKRHVRLEQGELSAEDYQENLLSVEKGFRVFSAFKTSKGEKLWVITEADRSSTTILLPSEY